MPIFLIMISHGLMVIFKRRNKYATGIFFFLILMFLTKPIFTASHYIVNGRDKTYSKDIIQFFGKNYQSNDLVYMNISAQFTFWYYLSSLDISHKFKRKYLGYWKGSRIEGSEMGKIYDLLSYEGNEPCFDLDYIMDAYNQQGYFRGVYSPKTEKETYTICKDSHHKFIGHNRVWLIFSHFPRDTQRIVLNYFDRHGRKMRQLEKGRSSIYLYDLVQK